MKIAIRANVPPLTPGHLVAFLKGLDGSGFDPRDDDFLDTVLEASIEDSQRDPHFSAYAARTIWKELNKPLSKLSPRNQFLAVAPVLEIGRVRAPVADPKSLTMQWVDKGEIHLDIPPMEGHPLSGMFGRPFVIDLGTSSMLAPVLTLGDPLVTDAKLGGFCEKHLGCPAVIVLHD